MTIRAAIYSILITGMSFCHGFAQEVIPIFGRVYADLENGPGYFKPLSNVLNSGLSAHWQGHRPQSRLRVGLSVIVARSFIPERHSEFEAVYTTSEGGQRMTVDAPAVFGRNESLVVTESNGYSHVFPGGFDYDFVTIAVPQLTVEGVLNSAVTLRLGSFLLGEDVGRFTTFGFSGLHHVAQYLDLSSTILAVSAGYQHIRAGDIWEASHSFAQLTGGRYGNVFHYYGSLGLQGFSQSLEYEEPFAAAGVQRIDIPAGNRFLLKIGAGWQWSVISAGLEVAPLAPFTVGLQLGLKI